MERFRPRQITGETKLLGLISQNVPFTLSPAIHNRAIQIFGLDQVYVNFDLGSNDIASFLEISWNLGVVGLNVTMPHKNLVASLLPNCSLKSVNTLVRGPSGWQGYSTDGIGFERGLAKIAVSLSSIETIIILGSGGAAQAVIHHALHSSESSLSRIVVLRRNTSRDQDIRAIQTSAVTKNHIDLQFGDWSPEALKESLAGVSGDKSKILLIQATSIVSSVEPALADFATALDGFSGTLVDLIYNKPSALYFSALHRGIKAQDGLPMLIEQARASQHLWWGKSASYEEMVSAIKNSGHLALS